MKNLKINNLDDLKKFIEDENVSKEKRFTVFEETLKGIPIICNKIELYENANKIDDTNNMLVSEMLNVIAEIKANPNEKHHPPLIMVIK